MNFCKHALYTTNNINTVVNTLDTLICILLLEVLVLDIIYITSIHMRLQMQDALVQVGRKIQDAP